MIEIITGTADNLIIAVAHEKVTAHDYEITLVPAIEAALKTHKKIRFLYQLGEDFHGFTPGAVWDDARLSLAHLTAFEAVAVVTDIHWIADSVKLFSFFIRCPVKVFPTPQLPEAKEWVAAVPAWRSLVEA
jgi:hypothetical protein